VFALQKDGNFYPGHSGKNASFILVFTQKSVL
jgi:hypothetical protein